jgi:hypothetical protein
VFVKGYKYFQLAPERASKFFVYCSVEVSTIG